jgi:hypothetical protein
MTRVSDRHIFSSETNRLVNMTSEREFNLVGICSKELAAHRHCDKRAGLVAPGLDRGYTQLFSAGLTRKEASLERRGCPRQAPGMSADAIQPYRKTGLERSLARELTIGGCRASARCNSTLITTALRRRNRLPSPRFSGTRFQYPVRGIRADLQFSKKWQSCYQSTMRRFEHRRLRPLRRPRLKLVVLTIPCPGQ